MAGGEDISAVYRKCEAQKRELETGLEEFANRNGTADIATQQRLSMQMQGLQQAFSQVSEAAQRIPEKNKSIWERRVKNLEDDVNSIQISIEKQLGAFYRAQKEQDDRQKLFGDRSNKKDDDDGQKALIKEQRALQSSSAMLDNALEQGQNILGNLVNQNKTLKGAKRKLLDAANVMGVSASLVSVIDRRHTTDKWIVYGCMLLTLFVLFSLWYLLKW